MMQLPDLVVAMARKSPLPGGGSQGRSIPDTPLQPEMIPDGEETKMVLVCM